MLRRSLVHVKYVQLLKQFNRNVFKWRTFEEVNCPTFLVIPDVPTVDRDYPLVNPRNHPNFRTITPDEVVRGASICTQEFESHLDELTEEIDSGETPIDFDYVANKLEKIVYPVDCADSWSYLSYLLNPTLLHQFACGSSQRKARYTKMERWSNKSLKRVIDALSEKSDSHLTEFDRGVLDLYQRQFKVNGIGLNPQISMSVLKAYTTIDKTAYTFRVLVEATAKKFKQIVDASCMPDAPKHFLESIRLKEDTSNISPAHLCEITLKPPVYNAFMTYCNDRTLRRNAWDSWVRRAGQSMHSTDNLTNHNNIPEIRKKRREICAALGFKNHAELKLSGHMAGKVEPVVEMLDLYRLKYWDKAQEEMANLVELGKNEITTFGFEPPLKPWDFAYLSRRYEVLNPHYDATEVKQYFSLDTVLQNTFRLCRDWFNIEIEQAPVAEPDKFYDGVTYYQVKDMGLGGKVIAGLYLDPYQRKNKTVQSAMAPLIHKSEVYGCDPDAYILLNLPRGSDGKTLLTMKDVGDWMQCLGNGLQHMLTRVDHAEVAGRNNLPPDAANICGSVFRRLARYPVILRALARHHESGEAMPDDLIHKVANARSHTGAMSLLEEMYLSAFDLEIWMTSEFWRDVQSKLWEEFMVIPEVKGDEWPSSYTTIFCDGRDATIYSNIWTQTVAVDIINTFEELNLDLSSSDISSTDMKPVMERFRSTFLSLGGAVPAAEVFRRFRGRDPVRTVDIL